jgi:hypothetical protein
VSCAGAVHLPRARGPRRTVIGAIAAVIAAAVAIVVWMATASAARASTPLTLTYDATATCPVVVTGDCTFANADAALQAALAGGSAQWALNIPGLAVGGGGGPTIAGATVTEDATQQSLVISGTLNGGLPIQATAVWPSGATAPELALAVKAPDGSLNLLNSLWSSSADPQLTAAVLLSSPDSTYQFDASQLPASAQSFYPADLGTPTLSPGLSLFAGVNVGATADPTLKNVLEYLGVGDTATISGTLSNSFAPLLSPTLATAADKAGLDLTLRSTETGGNLPSWLDSRSSSLEFKLPASGLPAVAWTDSLQTTIGGQPNTFTGSLSYDPTTEGGSTIAATYEVASGAAFNAPFGLGALQLSDTKLALTVTTGDSPTFAADLTSTVTLNAHTFDVTAHLDTGGGAVNGDLSVSGSVTVADAVALGNQLLGTNVTAGTGSVGDDLTLTGVEFSFSTTTTTPADRRFALTAATTFRGATASVLVSLDQSGTDPAKLFVGAHVANLDFSQLVGQASDTFTGLTFPSVDVFVSKGYLDNGKPTDVAWGDLLPAEQTFFSSVYGTSTPATVSFGANLTFAGTMTLPDTVAGPLGVTDPVQLSGDLGFGLNTLGDSTAPKLGGTLTAVLPAATAGLPSWLSNTGPWTVTIAADTNKNVQLSVDGSVTATVQGTDYTVSINGLVARQNGALSFELSGTIDHDFTPLFGVSWLGANKPTIKLSAEHSGTETTFSASLDTELSINGYVMQVAADISNKDGTSASLTLTSVDSTATLDFSAVANFFGAANSDLPSIPLSVTLNALSARAAVSSGQGATSVSIDIVADTTVSLGSSSFSSTQLLSIVKPSGGSVQVVVGFKPTDTVKLSDIVPNPPTDFSFPSFAIVAAHPAATLKFADLLPAEQDFFQPFCGDADSACHDKLSIADGITVVSATTVPSELDGVLDQLHVSHTAPVLVSGTIPFSGSGSLDLKVELPAIPATGPDFYDGGQLSFEISDTGLSLNGTMTFNIPKGSSVSSESACTAESGVWRTPNGGTSSACYDQVPFTVSAGISLSAPVSITLTGGLDPGYHWVAPMGQTWLTLTQAQIQFSITLGESVQFGLGFQIGAVVGGHDFSGSILASLIVGPPLGLNPNLEGFRIASGSGLSAQDLVDLANATGAHVSLQSAKLPNIAVRNVLLSFSQINDKQLCLTQGIHIAGDLYINPGSGAQTVDSSDCGADGSPAQNRTTICQQDSDQGCLVGVDVAVSDKGIKASGTLGAFTAGPLKFGGALVDLEITPTTQHLILAGQMSIQDFASGSVDLLISPTQAHFRGSVQLFGSGLDAYIDGSAAVNIDNLSDLKNVAGFNITAVLKSDWLNQAGVAISGTLSKLRPAVQAIGAVLQDLNNGDVLGAMFELPTQAAQLGVALPEPWGSAFSAISSDLKTIKDGVSALGHPFTYALNDVLNGFTLSFPGIPGTIIPQTCVTTWQDGQCWTTPPWHTIFGTVPGIPGFTVGPTCITTMVDGTCYSIPPIAGIHIPGICNDLQNVIPGLTCDQNGIADDLLFPALKAILKQTIGYDIGNVTLSSALNSIDNALGSGQTFAIDCAEFQASATLGTTPNANVSLSAHVNLFGNELTPQISWNFAPDSSNVATDIQEILDSIIHPTATGNGTCALPADWNTNADFPDAAGTGPNGGGDTGTPVVLPTPPAMTASLASPVINEGGTATLNGTITPAPSSTQTITVDWADGSTSTTTTASDGSFTASHDYPNNTPIGQPSGQYLLTASGDGLTASANLTVQNVAPANLQLTPSRSAINEGDAVTLQGSFTDPGADTHTVSVDWGDGSASQLSLAVGTHTFTTPAHTYADNNGTNAGYQVTATVTDDDLAGTTASLTEAVANVAPGHIAITQLPAAGVTCDPSGCALTTAEQQAPQFRFTFTDPGVNDTVVAVINWGDGQTDTVNLGTNRSLVLPHVWTEADTTDHPDGKFPISVTLTDKDGGVGTGSVTETVTNVAPSQLTACLLGTVTDAASGSACPATATINEGDTVQLFGGFTDPSSGDTHTVQIDWGAGWPSGERYQTLELPVGTFGYSATRQFGDEDTYAVKVTVTDDDGAATSTTSTLTVKNVAPTAVIDRSQATTVQQVPTVLTHAQTSVGFRATSFDPGNDALTATWDWKDATTTVTVHPGIAESSPENPHVAPQNITDTTSHSWANACVYPTTFTVADGDGGTTTDQMDVVVTGNATRSVEAGDWAELYRWYASGGRHFDAHHTPQLQQTLDCYLKIVQRMSAVFGGPASKVAGAPVPLTSDVGAAGALQPRGDVRAQLNAQILSLWLNYASGVVDYNQQIALDPERGFWSPRMAFSSLMSTAEQLSLNPAATDQQLRTERNLLTSIHIDAQ